jgi:hypothetical protein
VKGNTRGQPKSALLCARGAESHAFLPGRVESFAVTLPDVGDVPDGLRLRCGSLIEARNSRNARGANVIGDTGVGDGGGVEWKVMRVELRKAGSEAGSFSYHVANHDGESNGALKVWSPY